MPKVKVMLDPVSYGQFRGDETKDCTVRALANAAGIPYDLAHAHMKAKGRPHREGMAVTQAHSGFISYGLQCLGIYGKTATAKALRSLTIEGKTHTKPGMTLLRACKLYPKGSYVILIRGHATALIDGQIVDSHPQSGAASVVAIYRKD